MFRDIVIYFIYVVFFINIFIEDTISCSELDLDASANMRHAVGAQIKNIRLEKLVETISYLQNLSERITNKKQWAAARWVENQFRKYGLNTVVQTYEYQNEIWPNVIAEINGISDTNQYILILAHLDSKTRTADNHAPGADDNGSGLAILLEIARTLSTAGVHRNIVFIAFSNEEIGQKGSKYYVQHLNPDMKIIGVINLDILGYNKPNELFYTDALACNTALKYKVKAAYRMIKNDLLGIWYGRDVVKIAGKPANKNLVFKIDSVLRSYTDIATKTVVGEDCG